MGWFSGKSASENALQAANLRGKARKQLAKGKVSTSMQTGVKARKFEARAARKGWW